MGTAPTHQTLTAKPGQEAIKSCIRRLSTYFLDTVFFARFVAGSAAAALFAAHRFFVAAMIAALPSGLSLRFAFFAGWATACSFVAAHLFRWASATAARPAALIPRFLRTVVSGLEPLELGSMARSSAI